LSPTDQTIEQGARRHDVDKGAAELTLVGCDDFSTKLLVKRLLAVADPEERQAAIEQGLGGSRAFGLGYRRRPAGENHALRLKPMKRLLRGIEWRDFGIDAGFADAPGDELSHLAPKVDDEDGFGGLDRHGGRIGRRQP